MAKDSDTTPPHRASYAESVPSRYADPVIPPFLTGYGRRTHAAIFSFWAGVMPPMPMFGRSLL